MVEGFWRCLLQDVGADPDGGRVMNARLMSVMSDEFENVDCEMVFEFADPVCLLDLVALCLSAIDYLRCAVRLSTAM